MRASVVPAPASQPAAALADRIRAGIIGEGEVLDLGWQGHAAVRGGAGLSGVGRYAAVQTDPSVIELSIVPLQK